VSNAHEQQERRSRQCRRCDARLRRGVLDRTLG
jgi:hypothetical protein